MSPDEQSDAGNESPKDTIERIGQGGAPIYADSTNVNVGYFGFRVTFGSLVAVTTEGETKKTTVVEYVAVGMSPEHAQSLHY